MKAGDKAPAFRKDYLMNKTIYKIGLILTAPFKLLYTLVQFFNNDNAINIIYAAWSFIGLGIFIFGHCYEKFFIAILGGIIIGICIICCAILTSIILDILCILSELIFKPLAKIYDKCIAHQSNNLNQENKEEERKKISNFIIK